MSSHGAIIEIMSTRKLTYLVGILFLAQVATFFLGAVISPTPNSSLQVLATKCIDPKADINGYVTTDFLLLKPSCANCINCKRIENFAAESEEIQHLTAEHVVFAFQIPLPRDKIALDYSRWQQNLMGILQLDIGYEEGFDHEPSVELFMKARLGYRNMGDSEDDWKLIDSSFVHRTMNCEIDEDKKELGYNYNCSMLNLFELGSLHHDYYLLNIRLPSIYEEDGTVIDINNSVGKLQDVWMVAIHQNGGFTKVWVSLKTVFFPIILIEMIWYWRRISQLPRQATLLEKGLFALGCALTFLNVPFEFFTLSYDMPWLILLNDIKQGVFYATLMIFWLIFAGEHCINDAGPGEKNGIKAYWKKLAVILFGCSCLLVFDICERGTQLKNPFYSIWTTEFGTNVALGFIILAGISAGVFFIFLCYMIYRVFMTISEKQASISSMSRVRQIHYQGIIWRFRFLMLATLVTAALTTIGFILGQVSEGQYKWDENISLEYTSGFMTGVYGMWNIYIFGLLFLYAPSHKNWPGSESSALDSSGDPGVNGEEIEFTMHRGARSDASEISSLTEFIRHQATD
eukprot:TCALIF_09017-PA protein Name:"Similar to wls Protein wntless (Drosophila sechellia)" AED:0.06 eAED:0.06 QI:0/0/0/1/0.66/0.5/4/0/572